MAASAVGVPMFLYFLSSRTAAISSDVSVSITRVFPACRLFIGANIGVEGWTQHIQAFVAVKDFRGKNCPRRS